MVRTFFAYSSKMAFLPAISGICTSITLSNLEREGWREERRVEEEGEGCGRVGEKGRGKEGGGGGKVGEEVE